MRSGVNLQIHTPPGGKPPGPRDRVCKGRADHRSGVVDPAFDWADDRPPRRPLNETVIYETHVKGFSMRHPDIPAQIRGTYAGLAHPAAISYLTDLGVTAEEIVGFCREHLAGFKVPKAVEFGELPKTSTGKVQKFVLREREWAGYESRIYGGSTSDG